MGLAISLRSVSVRRGRRWVLKDIDLELRPPVRCALLGENGAGKTQLLKLIKGDVWPTPTGRESRTYSLGGRPLALDEAKARIVYLGAELQDKYLRYGWDLPLEELIATGLHGTDLLLAPISRGERQRVRTLIGQCGLARLARRPFTTLSHGEQRLALLARALAPASEWLLLDELYNGLDAGMRARIDHLLESRAGEVAWIVAAHRAQDIPRPTRELLELEAGRLGPLRRLTRSRLASLDRAAEGRRTVVARGTGAGRRTGAARGTAVARRTAGRGRRAGAGPVVLRLRRASIYLEGRRVLRDVSWTVRAGEHWAVLGANGAGKSTLLRTLYGDLAPALGGRLERRGHRAGTPIEEWKRRIGYVSPQLQSDYQIEVSLLELVASGRHASIGLNEALSARDRSVARHWLRVVGLTGAAARRPRELSYGQLRRALIARALCAGASLLLLDEPLSGLDAPQRARMKLLLERLMSEGVTVIMAVHHPEDLPHGMTHALRLEAQRATPHDLQSANSVGGKGRAGGET